MLKQITVLPKSKAKEFCPDCCWAAISISTYKDEFAKLLGCKRLGLLQQCFPDFEKPILAYPEESERLFTKEQAGEILDFVESQKDKIEHLLVHCEAGVCRSPAIAAAITLIFLKEWDGDYFLKYRPNRLVYNTLLEVAVERGLLGEEYLGKPLGYDGEAN